MAPQPAEAEQPLQGRQAKERRALVGAQIHYLALRAEALTRAQKQAFFDAAEEQRLLGLLRKRGGGSALRGWRKELDPYGLLEVPFPRFCEACVQMGHVKDVQELYAKPREFVNITLSHALSGLGALIEAFRAWILQKFGSSTGLSTTFDLSCRSLSSTDFKDACWEHGFLASEGDFDEICCCCDVEGKDVITSEDLSFLETDPKKRAGEAFKRKKHLMAQHEMLMVRFYNEGHASGLPPRHRLRIRPWEAKHFEEMPAIERQRQVQQERQQMQRGLEARSAFLRHLRGLRGNEVVAWRRGLDPEARFVVSEAAFRRYCRAVDFRGSIDALWANLDPDSEGQLTLEQLSVHAADLLASFCAWARDAQGSCVALWDAAAAAMASPRDAPGKGQDGGRAAPRPVPFAAFAETLRGLRCPMATGRDSRFRMWFLCRALDCHGCGLLFRSDLEWLDSWRPSEWLAKSPDKAAWEALRLKLTQKHGHVLRAWRLELDTDSSNRLSWNEFRTACERVGYQGNVGGAWRWLDQVMFGCISLRQVDEESSELLYSFKDWAETHFGSLQRSFKAISFEGAGAFTFQELKNVVAKFKWGGDMRLLFKCLSVDGHRVLFKDIEFLSRWTHSHNDNAADFKRTMDVLWKELQASSLAARSASKHLPLSSMCSSQQSWSCPALGAGSVESTVRSASTAALPWASLQGPPLQRFLLPPVSPSSPPSAKEPLLQLREGLPDAHCSPRAARPGEPYGVLMRTAPSRQVGRRRKLESLPSTPALQNNKNDNISTDIS